MEGGENEVTEYEELDRLCVMILGATPAMNLEEAVECHEARHVKMALLETELAPKEKRRWGYVNAILQRWAREGYPPGPMLTCPLCKRRTPRLIPPDRICDECVSKVHKANPITNLPTPEMQSPPPEPDGKTLWQRVLELRRQREAAAKAESAKGN